MYYSCSSRRAVARARRHIQPGIPTAPECTHVSWLLRSDPAMLRIMRGIVCLMAAASAPSICLALNNGLALTPPYVHASFLVVACMLAQPQIVVDGDPPSHDHRLVGVCHAVWGLPIGTGSDATTTVRIIPDPSPVCACARACVTTQC